MSSDVIVCTLNRKNTTSKWGFNWNKERSQLGERIIDSLEPGSIADKWNKQEAKKGDAEKCLRPGDKLFSANGRLVPTEIKFELQKKTVVLEFKRVGAEEAAAVENSKFIGGMFIGPTLSWSMHTKKMLRKSRRQAPVVNVTKDATHFVWTVVLTRPSTFDWEWGFRFDAARLQNSQHIIESLAPASITDRWNKRERLQGVARRCIRANDELVLVNGKKSPKEVQNELQRSEVTCVFSRSIHEEGEDPGDEETLENRENFLVWSIVLTRLSTNLPWGFKWNTNRSVIGELVLESLEPGSVVECWNIELGDCVKALQVKDQLISVNSRTGPKDMVSELQKKEVVLEFRREKGTPEEVTFRRNMFPDENEKEPDREPEVGSTAGDSVDSHELETEIHRGRAELDIKNKHVRKREKRQLALEERYGSKLAQVEFENQKRQADLARKEEEYKQQKEDLLERQRELVREEERHERLKEELARKKEEEAAAEAALKASEEAAEVVRRREANIAARKKQTQMRRRQEREDLRNHSATKLQAIWRGRTARKNAFEEAVAMERRKKAEAARAEKMRRQMIKQARIQKERLQLQEEEKRKVEEELRQLWYAETQLKKKHDAIMLIQSRYKGILARRYVRKLREARAREIEIRSAAYREKQERFARDRHLRKVQMERQRQEAERQYQQKLDRALYRDAPQLESATRIQAAFRGKLARAGVKERMHAEHTSMQERSRAEVMRKSENQQQKEIEQRQAEDRAALSIQTRYRGKVARQQVSQTKSQREAERRQQEIDRQKQALRRRLAEQDEERRKEDEERRKEDEERRKERHAAATKLQSSFRGKKARQRTAGMRDEARLKHRHPSLSGAGTLPSNGGTLQSNLRSPGRHRIGGGGPVGGYKASISRIRSKPSGSITKGGLVRAELSGVLEAGGHLPASVPVQGAEAARSSASRSAAARSGGALSRSGTSGVAQSGVRAGSGPKNEAVDGGAVRSHARGGPASLIPNAGLPAMVIPEADLPLREKLEAMGKRFRFEAVQRAQKLDAPASMLGEARSRVQKY